MSKWNLSFEEIGNRPVDGAWDPRVVDFEDFDSYP